MRIIIILLFTLFLSSCATQYMPTGSFIPLMEEKKDIKAALSISTNSLQGAIAYSPFKHFALKTDAGFSYNNLITIEDNGYLIENLLNLPLPANHKYFETSAGYFNKFNKRIIYEIYTGVGYGRTKFYLHCGTGTYQGEYFQPNINLNFAYKLKNNYIGTSVKTNYNFYNVSGTRRDGENCYNVFKTISYEPYIFFKTDLRIILTLKVGTLLHNNYKEDVIISENDQQSIEYSKLHISLNISYNFNKQINEKP